MTLLFSEAFGAGKLVGFEMHSRFLVPPACMKMIGESHGDIAISPDGEIFVSVEAGEHPGIQVYNSRGRYLRNVPNAPYDIHGFSIAPGRDGRPNIFGVSVFGQRIVQLTLRGELVQEIPGTRIPEQYKKTGSDDLPLALTGIAVAPNGDIYVVDGYGLDFIHRFDRDGHYLNTFGGREFPYGFNTCHKIIIDPRFSPERLLCADRDNNRLVSMSLNGEVQNSFSLDLRSPSALAVWRDELAVAELGGRVSVFDREWRVVGLIGSNDNRNEVKTNRIPPERWRPDVFYAPHGIAYDPEGNLLVTEWSQWGRVVRLERR
jgi:DNA-binding beta-propeller fold protein YncE